MLSFAVNEYAVFTFSAYSIEKIYARFVNFCVEVPLCEGRYFCESFSDCVSVNAALTLVTVALLPIIADEARFLFF